MLIERIAARNGGDGARLAGDDLVGATIRTRAAGLHHALRQRDAYALADLLTHR